MVPTARQAQAANLKGVAAQHRRELVLWTEFWRKPQAIVWERNGMVEIVALFVRQFAEGEIPRSSAENRKTIRMLMADLYLTPDSLARARLKIGEVVAPAVTGRTFRQAGGTSHLSVVVPPSDDD